MQKVQVNVHPRMLACLRLLPFWLQTKARYYSVNGRADPKMTECIKDVIEITEGELVSDRCVASTMWASTHSILAACFLNAADKCKNDHILGVIEKWGHCYGCDEAVLVWKRMFVTHYFNDKLFNMIAAETGFPVESTIVRLKTTSGKIISQGETKFWSLEELNRVYQEGLVAEPTRGPPKGEWTVDNEGYPAIEVLGKCFSTKEWFINAGKVMVNTPAPVKELVTQARRNIASFRRRLIELQRMAATAKITTAGVDITANVVRSVDALMQIFQDEPQRIKKVWAPLAKFTNSQNVMNKLRLSLSDQPCFSDLSYDETLAQYLRYLNMFRDLKVNGRTVEPLGFHDYARHIRRSPLVDQYLKDRSSYYHANWEFPEGVDGITRATKDIMVGSLGRYLVKDAGQTVTPGECQRIAESIIDHNPELYLDAELSDPRKILKSMVQKYSPSIPFIGTTNKGAVRFRKRRDLRAEHWDSAIVRTVKHWVKTGTWLPMLYHAFPKSQVVNREKLDKDPFKLRSITGQNLLSYVQSMIFCMDVNKRRHWFTSPGKVGMPLNGAAMNFVFGEIATMKYKVSLDITAMDAHENKGIFDVIAEIRKRGFANHPQREAIGKHIDCMYQAIRKGYLVNLVDEVAVVKKVRGGATGHSNVTTDNTIALQVILMHAFWKTHGLPPEQFFQRVVLANQSDDNMCGTNMEVNWNVLFSFLEKEHGITCRMEGQGTIYGQTFLGKRVEKGTAYRSDFDMIGIDPPAFAVIHDHKNMLMRYLDFKVEKTHRFRNKVEQARYMIERIQGDILLTAHQRKLYNAFKQDYDHFMARLPRTLRESPRFIKTAKIPTYRDVVAMWYKDFDPMHLDVFQRLRYTFLWTDLLVFNVGKACNELERFTNDLPVRLLALDDPQLFEGARYCSGHFEVERFLYYAAYHRNGVPPDVATMDYLQRQSPFSSFIDIPAFMNTPMAEVEVEPGLVERRFLTAQNRMILLGSLYIQVNRILEVAKLIPGGALVTMIFSLYSFTVPRLYSMGNFVHWVHQGQSSPELSAMVPRDMYYNHKYIALRVLESCPITLEKILAVDKFIGMLTWSMVKLTQLWQPTLGQGIEQMTSASRDDTRPDWDEAVADILRVMQQENTSVSITAPTGTGKSYWMPRSLIVRVLDGVSIRQVILLMPRRILFAEIGLPNIHWLKKGQEFQVNRTFVTATYGHFYERVKKGFSCPPGTMVIMDEAHEESPEMVAVMRMLVPAGFTILATATPVFKHVPMIPNLQLKIAKQYSTEEVELIGHNPIESYIWCERERPAKLQRVLFIEPSLRECEKIVDSLAQIGVAATLVHSKSRRIPERGHIVATQVVDAGINIKGVTAVIDSGTSIVNHKGWIGKMISPCYVSDQRRGRTGRFCDGLYITCRSARPYKPESYPSVASTLENPDLAISLGAKVKLVRTTGPESLFLNQYAIVDRPFGSLVEKKLVSAWHYLSLDKRPDELITTWRSMSKGVCPEECEYLLDALELTSVPPVNDIRQLAEKYLINYECDNGEHTDVVRWGQNGLGRIPFQRCPLPEFLPNRFDLKEVRFL